MEFWLSVEVQFSYWLGKNHHHHHVRKVLKRGLQLQLKCTFLIDCLRCCWFEVRFRLVALPLSRLHPANWIGFIAVPEIRFWILAKTRFNNIDPPDKSRVGCGSWSAKASLAQFYEANPLKTFRAFISETDVLCWKWSWYIDDSRFSNIWNYHQQAWINLTARNKQYICPV